MATNEAVGTDELLRNILLELQTLNRNLKRPDHGEPSREANCVTLDTDRVTASSKQVLSAVDNSSQAREGATISFVKPPLASASERKPLAINKGDDEAILWMKSVLPFEEEEDIPGLFSSSYYAYHWLLPADDWVNSHMYTEPLTARVQPWSNILPFWGIPHDGRLKLSFETDELRCIIQGRRYAYPNPSVIEHLKTLRDTHELLWKSPVGDCGIIIIDHLDDVEGSLVHYGASSTNNKSEVYFIPKATFGGEMPKNPWTRVIILGGTCSTLQPGGTLESAFPWFAKDSLKRIKPSLRAHSQCLGKGPPGFPNFHLSYYQIKGPIDAEVAKGKIWKCGPLHSDRVEYWGHSADPFFWLKHNSEDESRFIRRSSFSLVLIFERLNASEISPSYWTLLALLPEGGSDTHLKSPLSYAHQITSLNVVDRIKFFLEIGLRAAINCMNDLHEYLEHLINGEDPLLDPGYHDSLLSDDDAFSRSKTYFWSINLLREIARNLDDIILEVDSFPKRWGTMGFSHESKLYEDMFEEVSKHWVEQFRTKQKEFYDLREEAKALRDGLFSASSVIESRASTRLGENIRLLTYVSIFFLPLSFCMSIWSINDDLFSLRSLIITATLIAVSTYVLVFNVNNIGELISVLKRPREWNFNGRGNRNKRAEKQFLNFDRVWTGIQFWNRKKRGKEGVGV